MNRHEASFEGCRGIRIEYDVWEPDADSRGVLVISHGLGEYGRRYDHVARRLSTLGLTVVVPDHRGHGRSGGARAGLKKFSDYTDDLDTLIDRVSGGNEVFLLGHSMGASIALSYALRYQSKLQGLVLSGAAVVPGADQPKAALAIAKVLGRFLPTLPTAKLVVDGISKDPAVVAAYNADPQIFRDKIPAGLAGGLVSEMDTYPSRLPSLTLPLLVLHGGEDKMTDSEGSRLVVQLAGSDDKTLKIYPGLYHEIFNEPEQDVVLDDVAGWLEAHL